ncbi:hypothetical protein ISN44_As07g005020 [Arabidopsis suecica]|uniref:Uncharacterized protein n=1 Tax=Arabidopsis suecica TaxID=45249 RepID=A0A8T2BL91_ARASU|nr:hypothetical protein ISN44_As07g005020 [Arabidopsis suecica]
MMIFLVMQKVTEDQLLREDRGEVQETRVTEVVEMMTNHSIVKMKTKARGDMTNH